MSSDLNSEKYVSRFTHYKATLSNAIAPLFKVVKLGDLLEVLTDYHANGAYEKLKANVELLDCDDYAVMIRTTNFEQNDFTGNLKYITEKAYSFLYKSKVYPGDLIMNKIANAGSVYLMPDLERPVSLAMNLFLLRVDQKKANPVYVYTYLKINEDYVKLFANGSVTKTITKDAVRNLEVILPERRVQDNIADFYLDLTTRIALLRETNATLEAIAQALFESWFVDFDPVHAKQQGLAPEGMDETTAALFPDSFEESELGLVPRGWTVKSVSDVAEIVKGKSYSSKDLAENHDTALVTLKSFERGGGFRLDGFKPYLGNYKPNQVVVPGDLIVAYTDVTQAAELIGKPAVVIGVDEYQTLVASLDVGIVRVHPTLNDRQFLYGLFKTEAFQAHTFAHTSGTTVLHLAKDGVGSFRFVCPSIDVIRIFADIAEVSASRQQTNIDQMRTLANLRDTLLPRLISGQLRLPETD
jgi:type I restriction enzyme S subunit